ncbi:NAD(P)H-dependent oxidoreductase [Streptomyces sp. HUAS 31]|uniref:NAD(P)H-dependent oxidoreductase n=2 Tax=Streptomyces TaxID=1883 RepID=A0A7H8TD66_STRCX|nr:MULTISPECIES: NAD(P)H-dependent oxidoreductase [Streptomyces]MCZ4609368.1 NAD(P)H-dependent oxidoreductase [Streptomyces sp. Lzd4kr]QWA22420.1 NAD(P)H-dependent oxidoreductase [Streptomyces sp. JCM17656]MBT1092206.1 NAD(P)H-dependent oxidoreductase [Streptomyces sp. Tu102]QEV70112.1 NADPH-dependent oxidoreductase [Streptomyces chartreusis]QKZ21449.1 NAD(P)H-dependent oxidoreductase [Streptomyces chartreusis]
MSTNTLKLAVILGSVREGRFGEVVTHWFAGLAKEHSAFDVEVIDLSETELPLSLPATPPAMATEEVRPAEMLPLSAKLAAADAFVVVTPEYNHSFPASLKALIDWHFTEWQAKPVGFVSYGAQSGGLRAVEQLRQVFAEMHAVTIRDGLAFPFYWEAFGEDGAPRDAEGTNGALKVMLDELAWWGNALHEARAKSPYNPEA